MPSLKTLTLAGLMATVVSTMPAGQRFTERQLKYAEVSKRQNEAVEALGLSDPDILQL